MYTYQRALAALKATPGDWKPVDLSAVPLREIYTQYAGAIVVVSVPPTNVNEAIDLYNLEPGVRLLQLTVTQWLAANGDQTLTTLPTIPTKTKKHATYRDLWCYGFQVQGYNRYRSASEQPTLTNSEIIDCLVTKSGVDYTAINNSCLFVVNGAIHYSVSASFGIMVADAGTSMQRKKDNRIGVVNFENVGTLQRVPITNDRMLSATDALPYRDAVYISLEGLDLQGKTVGVVIGGILHINDDICRRVGNAHIKLTFTNYPFVDRYWWLTERVDTSSIVLSTFENRPDKLVYDELTSNANIVALLTLSQSFLVVFDCPVLYSEKRLVHQAELAGRYMTYAEPHYPLVSGTGEFVNYTSYAAKYGYVVRTSDYQYTNLLRYTFEYQRNRYTTEHRMVQRPTRYQYARWWELYSLAD